ncbi:MAG: Coenzyme F420 hydrogenase/dehydrogenase, beta subunit C-terminal domain [Deltaproteobacteria bacterium]|jgi:ferredoxin|nr:Coenzyme F420 hydrogenase/dehydrogenase, beta subunit C-terminal domain [Deltaproteobacteria bacterium]
MPALEDVAKKIRESAKRLLAEGRAEVVVGYRRGTIPLTTAPFFARTAEECDQLVWSNFARINLANYLPGRKKVALVAKGCDARSAVGQVVENQIPRDELYVIGVPCTGMVDNALVAAKEPRPIREVVETTDDSFTLKGEGYSVEVRKEEVLRRNCRTCAHRTPKLADELAAPEVPGATPDDFADIKALASKTPAERLAHFKDLIKDCLRCYACRNACPLCYCPICFVDETRPQWLGKSNDPMDTLTFHLLRGLHCSGRCTSCGACETVCPVNIKVREFNRILELTVQKEWQYEPGLSWDQKPPLTMFQTDDAAEFIK